MSSSHLFLCLPRLLPPFTVPCKMVLTRPDERETWPYHCSLRFFTVIRRSQGWNTYALSTTVLFSELQEGKCDRGAPRKRYKDHQKRQLAPVWINHQQRQREASDRDSCRASVRESSVKFETDRHEAAKERRGKQKVRAASLTSSARTFASLTCSSVCVSSIGLYSHSTSLQELTVILLFWEAKNTCWRSQTLYEMNCTAQSVQIYEVLVLAFSSLEDCGRMFDHLFHASAFWIIFFSGD